MKNKENHILMYNPLALGFFALGLCGLITFPIWTRQRGEDQVVIAKQHAEVLGYQVFELYRDASKAPAIEMNSSRSPASMRTMGEMASFRDAGSIGADPWGQPYRYKILGSNGTQVRLQVWSAGPNRIFETPDQPGVESASYVGDDVGVVLSIAVKSPE